MEAFSLREFLSSNPLLSFLTRPPKLRTGFPFLFEGSFLSLVLMYFLRIMLTLLSFDCPGFGKGWVFGLLKVGFCKGSGLSNASSKSESCYSSSKSSSSEPFIAF